MSQDVKTSAGEGAAFTTAAEVHRKIEFTREEIHALILEDFKPEARQHIPEEFLDTLSAPFMCGVRNTIKKLGYVVKDQTREKAE